MSASKLGAKASLDISYRGTEYNTSVPRQHIIRFFDLSRASVNFNFFISLVKVSRYQLLVELNNAGLPLAPSEISDDPWPSWASNPTFTAWRILQTIISVTAPCRFDVRIAKGINYRIIWGAADCACNPSHLVLHISCSTSCPGSLGDARSQRNARSITKPRSPTFDYVHTQIWCDLHRSRMRCLPSLALSPWSLTNCSIMNSWCWVSLSTLLERPILLLAFAVTLCSSSSSFVRHVILFYSSFDWEHFQLLKSSV